MSNFFPSDELIGCIDACLPQTQCTQCGYNGCLPYAEAVARGEADINQCPPGGEVTINALATLLQVEAKPLNPKYGLHKPRTVAWIEEALCIGCTLCIKACPVDAILGATKQMHAVLTQECTGCELCVAPCPVDCIYMRPVAVKSTGPWSQYTRAEADRWRARADARRTRLERRRQDSAARSPAAKGVARAPTRLDSAAKKADIRAAVARVRQKRRQALP